MSSIKALKKLAKKVDKKQTKAKKQLSKLVNPKPSYSSQQSQLAQELKNLSQQTLTSITAELATPFNPVLSWFGKGLALSPHSLSFTSPAAHNGSVNMPPAGMAKIQKLSPAASLARLPLKSPPCKRCPALAGGNCKCAMKKFAK